MKNRFLKAFILSVLLITALFFGMASAWEIPGGWDNFNRALRVIPDGTSTAPAWAFKSEPTLGFYRSGSGVISLAGGTLSMLGGTYILSDADVAHGMTTVTATTNYGLLSAISGTDGGLSIQGLSDTDAIPLYIRGIIGSTNPTDTLEAISLVGAKKNGTGVQALGSTETVIQILNNTTELFTQTGDGSYRQPASTYHNFGATIGTGGYGIYDNAGTLQFKNSGGVWADLVSAVSAGGWQDDGTVVRLITGTDNVGMGGATAGGTNLAGGLVMGVGTAATGTITGAQLWAANFNGASTARVHTMTQEGQSAALATVNETAIYYGVTWDESADTYTRTGRTSGHKTGATLPSSMLPIQRMMERVLLNDDGTVNYVLSPTDSTKKIDGSTASDLTGTDGQVMVRIPKFWYRYSYTGTTHTWEVSPVAMSGFDPHPAFYKDGAWVDYRYIGAYEASLYDVSISAYVDGIYQTAVSAVFDTTDDSITIASRSNWATNLTVGQKLVITGTVSNNATLTVASLVSGTKITVSENLTNETAAATVIATQKDYTATTGDKLSSVSGKAAINYLTRANARVIAANRGAGWRQIDFDLISAIQMLYLTEYASFDSQSMIGTGITAVTDWDTYNAYNPIAKSGNSNSIGNATGNTGGSTSAATESTKYLSYRGIENWFGHLWKWVDGFNINDNIPYVTNNATNWADDTAVNYTRLVNVLGANITLHNADGYPATIQKTGKGFLAASVGASSSTKITDYYYQAAAWRVAFFGGLSDAGAAAGGFYWALDNSSAFLYRTIGGRLSF